MTEQEKQPAKPPAEPDPDPDLVPQVAIGTQLVSIGGRTRVAMSVQVTVFFKPEDAIQFGRDLVHEGQQGKTGLMVAGANTLGKLKLG